VDREPRHNARGPVAAEKPLVQAVARVVPRRETLLDGLVSDHRKHPSADFFSVGLCVCVCVCVCVCACGQRVSQLNIG